MNKVILIGRLTKDPQVRYTPNQKVVCTFNLAVDRPFTNQQGEREADFIPIVLWGRQAELAGNSCAKGHKLAVEGRMQVRTYEDKETHKTVWVTEVIGDRIEFLEKKGTPGDYNGGQYPDGNQYQGGNSYGNNYGGNNGYQNTPANGQAPQQPGNYNGGYGNGYKNGPAPTPMAAMGTDIPFDEEVPF